MLKLMVFLPESCLAAQDIPSFFEELEKQDAYFSDLVANAEEDGKRLRMIAELKEGKAKISLQSVGADNPFYNLSGSDNMIVFTSKRYFDRPLVIRGPGAGAEVTAAGVFC